MIDRLAKSLPERSRTFLVVAVALAVLAGGFGPAAISKLTTSESDFQDPASEYERANAAIHRATGYSPYYGIAALVSGQRRFETDTVAQRAVEDLTNLFKKQPGYQQSLNYPNTQLTQLISRDGRETVLLVGFATPNESEKAISKVQATLRNRRPGALAGMTVRFGGPDVIFNELNRDTVSGLTKAELFAIPLILLLSFWVFRGFVAALLPPLVGGLAILLTFFVFWLVEQVTPVSIFSLNLVMGMGLGLGIDYSLFVLSRYREELATGRDVRAATTRTIQTAGRTVLYSSVTVAAALAALLVFHIRFLSSMGVGGAAVALCDGAVAIVVLPAVLFALGPRINALSPAWLQRRAAQSAVWRKESAWWRLAQGVMQKPAAVAIVVTVALLVMASPAVNLKLTDPGANLLPASTDSFHVERALAHDFNANPAETINIVAHGSFSTIGKLASSAAGVAGANVTELPILSLGKGIWEINLLPRDNAFSENQQRLVRRLRVVAKPYGALVGGATAFFIDQKASIASSIPTALVILLLVTGASLFLMTGSVVLPLKAFIMNMATIGVGAGMLVFVFQDGHLASLIGIKPVGGLEEASLVLMFVIAFALSTDYEVFVLGRVKELHDAGMNNREAIAHGLDRTGRLVTAAALLFCTAVGALATTDVFFTKQFGFGTALAVAVDASLVRAFLVPAFMVMLGERNWWAPSWLKAKGSRGAVIDEVASESTASEVSNA
jgi:uncharacterized membrane protein YdfJ with MMPL/SSD domain